MRRTSRRGAGAVLVGGGGRRGRSVTTPSDGGRRARARRDLGPRAPLVARSGRASSRCSGGRSSRLDADSSLARRLRVRLAAEQAYVDGDPAPVLDERRRGPVVRRSDPAGRGAVARPPLPPRPTRRRAAPGSRRRADRRVTAHRPADRRADGPGLAHRRPRAGRRPPGRRGRSAELRDQLDVHRCDGLRYLVESIDVMLAVRERPLRRGRGARRGGATSSASTSATPMPSAGTAPS